MGEMKNGIYTRENIQELISRRRLITVDEFFKRSPISKTEDFALKKRPIRIKTSKPRVYAYQKIPPPGNVSMRKLRVYEQRDRKSEIIRKISFMKGFESIKPLKTLSSKKIGAPATRTHFHSASNIIFNRD